jgi:dipeptidyl aminopeptidase/acylaminoacyl peptidase
MPTKKRPLTIEQALRLRGVGDPRPSPDGRRVVYTLTCPVQEKKKRLYRTSLWLVSADGGEPRQLTTEGSAREPRWSPDGSTIAFVARRGDDRLRQIWLLPADGGEARQLTHVDTAIHGLDWSPDGTSLLYLAREPMGDEEKRLRERGGIHVVDRFVRMTQIHVVDIETGRTRQLTRDRSSKAAACWSPNGRWIAYEKRSDPTANQSYRSRLCLMDAQGKNKRTLSAASECDTSPRWSPDSRQIAFLRREAPEYARQTILAVRGTAANARVQLLTETLDRSVVDARWSTDGRRLFALIHDGLRQHVHAITAKAGRRTQLTDGDREISSLRVAGRDRLLYLSEAATQRADLFACDSSGGDETRLTDSHPALADAALGSARAVRWNSADGTEIEGLLLLPPSYRKGRRVPLVVEPHGGPAGCRGFSFYSNWHVLAGRGYAVLAPNFRGSSGYGGAFLRANEDDFGGGDFADVMAGVDAMVERGIAHPKKLAIMGYSYGGYMTAWAIGQTERFAAAIAGAGVINLTSFYGTTDIQWFTRMYQKERPWKNPDSYVAQSPLTHVARAPTPTLIYHGDADRRVPLEQSEQLYVALRERGVPVEFVRYPREGHGLGEYWHRRDAMERIVAWLDRWVKG